MKFYAAALALASAVAVNAQVNASLACLTTTQFAEQVPVCARQCETAALSSDGCPFEDLTCHCLNTNIVASLIEPCLITTSNCTEADVAVFAGAITQICEYLNATAAGTIPKVDCSAAGHQPNGTCPAAGSCNGTSPAVTRPPIASFTGAASSLVGSGLLAAAGVAAALFL